MTGGYIYKVPNWIRSLTDLQLLTLHVNELEAQDVLALGRLPALVSLRLTAHESFRGARVRIGGLDGFPSLRSLEFRCAVPVSFGAGAMPRLGKLSLKFYPLSTDMLMLTSNGEEYRRKI
jgi:disease resistance protein RPM1